MWIVLVEVSEKGAVGEMEQSGSVISHHIVDSWDKEPARTVSMEALVSAGFVA